MFYRFNYISLLFVFLFFLAIALIRSQNAFNNEYVSLAFEGDGHGTIATFADYNKQLNDDGLWKLFGDRWYSRLGGGYHEPGVVSIFWKSAGLLFSELDPDDLYDACVLLLYALNGLAVYLLARYIRLHHYYALLSAVFVVSLQNFDDRIRGHLTLAAYFGFILVILFLLAATKNPKSLKKTLLLGFIAAFSFSINEYYGLFMLEISTIYYFIVVWKKTNILYAVKNGIYCSIAFVSTLSLIFPFTLLGPLFKNFDNKISFPSKVVPQSDYLHYSLHNPLELFTSNLDIFYFINNWIYKTNYFSGAGGEFSYRIGFTVILFFVAILFINLITFGKILFIKLIHKIAPWLLLYFLTFLISIHPDHPLLGGLSFVNLHMDFSSILRVNSRAMVLGNVFLIFMLGIVVNEFAQNIRNSGPNLYIKILVPAVMIFSYYASLADARGVYFTPWDHWSVQSLPKSVDLVTKLNGLPKGMVMDIPFHHDNVPPETNYVYALNSAYHGNDIVNFVGAKVYKNLGFRWWSREVNNPNTNTIDKIVKSGIKYIIVWNNPENLPFGRRVSFDPGFYNNAPNLKIVASNEIGTIYEVIGVKSYNKKEFGKIINNTPNQGRYSHQMMHITYPERRIADTYNNLKFILNEGDINRYIIYGPYDWFEKGDYNFSFRFEETLFVNKDEPCLKLEILSYEDGMLAENSFSQKDFQKNGNRIDFDVILNSLGSIELRVMPLCQGEIVFSEITFRKTNIVN